MGLRLSSATETPNMNAAHAEHLPSLEDARAGAAIERLLDAACFADLAWNESMAETYPDGLPPLPEIVAALLRWRDHHRTGLRDKS